MHMVLLLLSLIVSTTRSSEPVTVERRAPTTQFVTFDPAHPPPDVAKLQHGENALTRMLFNCTVKLKYETIDKHFHDGQWHVTTRLGEVDVTLDLTNTIYLPEQANDRLRAHEMGHAKINGIIYREDADDAANRFAREAMHRTWEGEGASVDAAGKTATDAAVNWIADQYLKATANKAFRIGEIYDDLTKHGTNNKLVSDAIFDAIEKQREEEGLSTNRTNRHE
jgi:hypothetical protein